MCKLFCCNVNKYASKLCALLLVRKGWICRLWRHLANGGGKTVAILFLAEEVTHLRRAGILNSRYFLSNQSGVYWTKFECILS